MTPNAAGVAERVRTLYNRKWADRRRQFGLRNAFKQIVEAGIRRVWRCDDLLVLAIFERRSIDIAEHADVLVLTVPDLDDATLTADVPPAMFRTLRLFLDQGLRGFLIRRDGKIAGYSFVQPSAGHHFRFGRPFVVPKGCEFLKNLYVFPEFRGLSLGKQLNAARVASIPQHHTPIVFVMRDNRVAIRNLKMYGFEEAVAVRRSLWFGMFFRRKIARLRDDPISRTIADGFAGGQA